MRALVNHLHCSFKGTLEVCEDCDTAKSDQKLLHKVAEEREIKTGKVIYLDLSSQKKLGYGGLNNWIPIQDLDKKQEWYLFTKTKYYLTEKFTPFPNKMKTTKKMSK